MIKSFKCDETAKIFDRSISPKFPAEIHRSALRKLVMLDAAPDLLSLRIPPGNKLEALKGNRLGQHSIRINNQWRICFIWQDGNAYNVEITDYH